MRRRVLTAATGAVAGATVLSTFLVGWTARPGSGLLLAIGILAVLAPAAAAAGVAVALRIMDPSAVPMAARLTALGTPVLVLLALFTIHAVAPDGRPGPQQIAALIIGSASAGALASRFAGTDLSQEDA